MRYLLFPFALLFTTLVMSQPGSLDKSFADTGVSISQNFTGICHDVIIQKDGKTVTIGEGGYNGTVGFLLVRYNTDGIPDLSFGDSGRVVTAISLGSRGFYGTTQEDGKILVAGRVVFATGGLGYNDLVVVRYNTDGSIDSSFGINGIARESIAAVNKTPSGIAVQPDGKIVMGGFTDDPVTGQEPPTFFLLRYNPDGSPDLSFGSKGSYEEEIDELIGGNAAGFALQPDGKILLGSVIRSVIGAPFFVRRYTNGGAPDQEFGTNGEARFYFNQVGGGDMYAIALRKDGRIVCGGNSALVQFYPDGSVDKTFGRDGYVSIYTQPYQISIQDIALQPDGKVIAGGTWELERNGNTAFALFRYEAGGAVDSSFGDDGIALTQIGTYPYADALALQKDNKVILGGYSRTADLSNYRVTLARYNNDESRRQIVVTRIRRWLQHHGITWQGDDNVRYYTVQRSTDGGATYQPVAKVYKHQQPFYNYEDAAVTGGNNDSYRIVTTGKDGRKTCSNTVFMDEAAVKLFPNPVRGAMQVQGLPANRKTNISILDFTGTVRTAATASNSNCTLNTSALKPGNYVLKIEHDNRISMQTFVKE